MTELESNYLAISVDADCSLICSGTLTSSTCKSHTEGGPAHSPHEGGILRPPGGVLSEIILCELQRKSLSISRTYIFEEEGITMHPGCMCVCVCVWVRGEGGGGDNKSCYFAIFLLLSRNILTKF